MRHPAHHVLGATDTLIQRARFATMPPAKALFHTDDHAEAVRLVEEKQMMAAAAGRLLTPHAAIAEIAAELTALADCLTDHEKE